MSLPDIMAWDEIEKFMINNPDVVLSVYTLDSRVFLGDGPIFLNGLQWDIDDEKFKRIPNKTMGLIELKIRDRPPNRESALNKLIARIDPIHNPRIVPLEPGLELDKMIAEQVLGWERSENILGWYEDQSIKLFRFYRFSTDIEAAWDLVEKFRLCVIPWNDGQWTATRITEMLTDGDRNKAATAPHAICLAALLYASENDE